MGLMIRTHEKVFTAFIVQIPVLTNLATLGPVFVFAFVNAAKGSLSSQGTD